MGRFKKKLKLILTKEFLQMSWHLLLLLPQLLPLESHTEEPHFSIPL